MEEIKGIEIGCESPTFIETEDQLILEFNYLERKAGTFGIYLMFGYGRSLPFYGKVILKKYKTNSDNWRITTFDIYPWQFKLSGFDLEEYLDEYFERDMSEEFWFEGRYNYKDLIQKKFLEQADEIFKRSYYKQCSLDQFWDLNKEYPVSVKIEISNGENKRMFNITDVNIQRIGELKYLLERERDII
jgi:hypothetical protein